MVGFGERFREAAEAARANIVDHGVAHERSAHGVHGIDLQPEIDRGLVRVQYDPPQEIEVDRHFHEIERIVQEFKPRRVVFDSISTSP